MRGVTFVESYIQDGAIFVTVQINGRSVGEVILTLEDWDHLRFCAERNDEIIVFNAVEAQAAEILT